MPVFDDFSGRGAEGWDFSKEVHVKMEALPTESGEVGIFINPGIVNSCLFMRTDGGRGLLCLPSAV